MTRCFVTCVLGLLTIACASGGATSTATAPSPAPQATAAVVAVVPAGRDFVEDRTFTSQALGRPTTFRVILPDGYTTTLRRYPTLYLLHGLTGTYSDWESRTDVFRHARAHDFIIVMPDGQDSWYTDSQGDPAAKFETAIARDLVAEVDRTYRTIATRHGRAIAGLSMGGYGALKYGVKYPSTFSVAGSFSGAVAAGSAAFTGGRNEKLAKELLVIYGPPDSKTRAENDLLVLIEKANPAQLPYLYLDCGTDDFLLDSNRALVAVLQKKKIAYEYHEVPGAHTWDYWDRQLPWLLRGRTCASDWTRQVTGHGALRRSSPDPATADRDRRPQTADRRPRRDRRPQTADRRPQTASLLLLLLLLLIEVRCRRAVGFWRGPGHHRHQVARPSDGVGERHLDGDRQLAGRAAAEDALGRRHVGVVAADGDADVPACRP